MEASTMRAIDWYVGVPLCYFLGFLTWFGRKLSRSTQGDKKEVKNILVAKFFGIGSLTLIMPTVKALKDSFPGARVRLLTFAGNREAAEILGLGEDTLYIETRNIFRFILSTLRAVGKLRREGVDVMLDLEFFAKFPLILGFLIGARRKAGFYLTIEPWRRALLDIHGYYNHYRHVKDIFLSLAYLAKEDDPYYVKFEEFARRYSPARLSVSEEDKVAVRSKLKKMGLKDGQSLIALNPNAGRELAPEIKRWPAEHFSSLADKVAAAYGPSAFLVFTGSPSERGYVGGIVAGMKKKKHIYNSAGEFSLRELLAFLSLADLLVSVDSGTMHVASLVNTPMVALFFAETPVLFGPTAERSRIIASDLYSVPMLTAYTGKQPFLSKNIPARLISPETVFSAVIEMLPPKSRSTSTVSEEAETMEQ